jgi:hypothetical protein
MITGRWSKLSAKHEVGYTGNIRFWVIEISKKSGVAERLKSLAVGASGPKIRQKFSSA